MEGKIKWKNQSFDENCKISAFVQDWGRMKLQRRERILRNG